MIDRAHEMIDRAHQIDKVWLALPCVETEASVADRLACVTPWNSGENHPPVIETKEARYHIQSVCF